MLVVAVLFVPAGSSFPPAADEASNHPKDLAFQGLALRGLPNSTLFFDTALRGVRAKSGRPARGYRLFSRNSPKGKSKRKSKGRTKKKKLLKGVPLPRRSP